MYIHAASTVALVCIVCLAWRQWQREHNPTWIPFIAGFLLVAAGSFLAIFTPEGDQTALLNLVRIVVEFVGFVVMGYWTWQYMRLRLNESIVMIAVGVTFTLATIVTLAFSTILIDRVTAETATNLVTDVKVLDYSVTALEGEALAKASLVASEPDISVALAKNDSAALDQAAQKFLETYNLGFLTVALPSGDVLVRGNALSRHGDSVAGERAFEEASQGNSFSTIEKDPVEGLSVRAGAPIVSAGKVIGVLIAGYPLDNAFADNMKRVTGLEMFVYDGDTSISSTAFVANGTKRLVGVKPSDDSVVASVINRGETVTANVNMYGEPFQASYAPLSNADGKVIGMLSAAKYQQDIVNIADATNRLTLITVILILLVLMTPIYLLAKRLSGQASIG
jgi:sensor histidine kinase regulating citrate/malate metabolism